MATDVKQIGELVRQKSEFVRALFAEMDKVIVGQRYMLERMLIGLLANGHILLEGVPGLAKTMAVTTLSRVINADFKRAALLSRLCSAPFNLLDFATILTKTIDVSVFWSGIIMLLALLKVLPEF